MNTEHMTLHPKGSGGTERGYACRGYNWCKTGAKKQAKKLVREK